MAGGKPGKDAPEDSFDDVKKLIRIMNENDLIEMEIEEDGRKIKLRKAEKQGTSEVFHHIPAVGGPVPVGNVAAQASGPPEEAALPDNVFEIKSPIVGTFYRSPAPESDSYTEIGNKVTADSTVCIVEAMKVMNEIKADEDGVVLEILIENGQAVEFGQVLFRLKKA